MRLPGVLAAAVFTVLLRGESPCPSPRTYAVCEIAVEINDAEAGRNPNPFLSVQLRAEFRSPRHRTLLLRGFWDGGRRMVIRFTPTEPGTWDYRITSNLEHVNNQQGQVQVADSESPGFIRAANVHHWSYLENFKAHLWMGDTRLDLATLPKAEFERWVDTRASQKFNHVRIYLLEAGKNSFPRPDQPRHEHFQELDRRIAYLNSKGMIADLVIGRPDQQLTQLFPEPRRRREFLDYIVARYSPYNITWELLEQFESYASPRDLAKELGLELKRIDPYQHPRSAHAQVSSAPLLEDGWMDHVLYGTADESIGSIEHQLFSAPFVSAGVGQGGNADLLRKQLWNATMNGQYPVLAAGAADLESPAAKQMTAWFDFFASTRHWELEPFFDLDGGRAIALPGVEYIVYVEKPSGPVEVRVEKHGYDVKWLDPATGEAVPQKEWKGEKFVAEPPDRKHDWVLHLSREGRKEGMLTSYKFESRRNLMQEIEQTVAKVPFEIVQPSKEEISAAVPPRYEAKLKRETRGTRSMTYLWTGEATAAGQGYRAVGTGESGTMRLPKVSIAEPLVFNVRLYGMNANGKVYATDRIYRLAR